MKTKILSITLLLLFIGCSEEVKKIVKSSTIVQDIEKNKYDRIKSISFYKQYENDNKLELIKKIEYDYNSSNTIDGKISKYFKETESNYKDGELDGLWTEWDRDGQKKEEGNYKDGKRDGKWTSWYDNSQKKEEGNYKDGNRDGIWTELYENGQKKEERTWKDGERDGSFSLWGREVLYFRDDSTGDYIYDSTGQVILDTTLYTKIENGNYLKGEMTGQFDEWYINGRKKKQYNHKIANFESDEERTKTIWSFKVGPYNEWYPDGKNKVMGSYDSSWVSFSKSYYEWSVSSKKIDTWTEWYENGNRKFVEQYKDRNLTHSLKFYENGMKEITAQKK